MAVSKKYLPGSEAPADEIFQYPFFVDKESKEFIEIHGKIMFIVRGLPGTAKSSLNELILKHFPSSVKCSADDYFTKTFTSGVRNRDSLKKSHYYCYNRVKQECERDTHPIIVTNTHVQRKEMQQYLNYAQDYGYTVIIANTLDKFEVSPKILADSNTKGLDRAYFEKRMKTWQDMFPLVTGWFLNEDDSFYVLHQLQLALDTLMGDGKFCRVFNVFDKDSLFNAYKAKEMLFCIAGFWKSFPFELGEYYKSTKVREAYGKCFSITIQAYVITESDIFALVFLDEFLKALLFEQNFEYNSCDTDGTLDIVSEFSRMSLKQPYKFKLMSLNSNFPNKCKTASLSNKSKDSLDINESGFIHLAEKDEKTFSAWELNKLLKSSFKGVVDDTGKVLADHFSELESGYKFCRLHEDAWVVMSPKDVSVKTVFTGLYL